MAGRPKTRAVLDRLTTLGASEEPEQTALEYVTHRLAGGDKVLDIAEELEKELKFPVQYGMVIKALKIDNDDVAVANALASARKEGAHAKVEEAEQIADDVAADKDMIARAKLQAEMRLWAAERNNRDAYGTVKAAPVTINIAELHIDSLRRMQANDEARRLAAATVVDAEVLAIESAPNEQDIEALI